MQVIQLLVALFIIIYFKINVISKSINIDINCIIMVLVYYNMYCCYYYYYYNINMYYACIVYFMQSINVTFK